MDEPVTDARPRRVAIVDASGNAVTAALLADAAEALPVYAELAGVAAPEPVRAGAGRDIAGCDTVLLALRLEARATRIEELPMVYAPAGARVYALICADGDPGIATYALAELEEHCEARGLAWMGGLAVGDADLLPDLGRRPRMGWARRRVSEALDALIIALLASRSFGERYVRLSRYARLVAGRRPI